MGTISISSPMIKASSPLSIKLKELQEVEDSIQSLRSQLLLAENRRDQLHAEVALHRKDRATINSLPPELLCAIFSLTGEEQAKRNARLRLVSRGWNSLVDNTPSLWSRINIVWGRDLKRLTNAWHYASFCLEKSQDCLLDIAVDLFRLPSYPVYLANLLNQHFAPLNLDPYCTRDNNEEYMSEDLEDIHVHQSFYNSLLQNTLLILTGKEMKRNLRWRTLRLRLPSHIAEENVREIVNEVSRYSRDLVELEISMAYGGLFNDNREIRLSIPYMPALKRFKTNREVTFENHSVTTGMLETMELTNSDTSLSLLWGGESSFSALKNLVITIWVERKRRVLNQVIDLPVLESLKASTDSPIKVLQAIKAPRLSELYLDGAPLIEITSTHIGPTPVFSTLKKLTFYVRFYTEIPTTVTGFEAMFRELLLQTPKLAYVTILCHQAIREITSERASKVVEEMRAGGKLLAPLKKISVIRQAGVF